MEDGHVSCNLMAERMLTAAGQAQLAVEFERVETEKMGAGTHERLHALMDQLCNTVGAS